MVSPENVLAQLIRNIIYNQRTEGSGSCLMRFLGIVAIWIGIFLVFMEPISGFLFLIVGIFLVLGKL